MEAVPPHPDQTAAARRRVNDVTRASVENVVVTLVAGVAFVISLTASSTVAAIVITVGAVVAAGRSRLRVRNWGSRWLVLGSGPRAVLLTASAVLIAQATDRAWASLAALAVAVVPLVLEPHLQRLVNVRASVVANLPGVRPVAPAPPLGPVVVVAGLLTSVLGAWMAVTTGPSAAWLWLLVCLLSLAPFVILVSKGRRRLALIRALDGQINAGVAAFDPQFILYTNRPDDASYQVMMWLPYLRRSGCRFVIVTRSGLPATALSALVDDVPVVQRRRVADLDAVITPSTRAAFYVNASSGNGAFVRNLQLTHVYLGHGDSDKPPSYNPTHAMFDRIFVAGPAAIRRYAAHGVFIAPEVFEVVGRPQVEGIDPVREGESVSVLQQPTVLYAPTWRGHVEETDLSSLAVGEVIVRRLLDRGARVIFRPHPFSYDFADDVIRIRSIHQMLAADSALTGREHVWGAAAETDLDVKECFNLSDAMISDVSSVVSDYLYSTKPFAMVAVSSDVESFPAKYPVAEASYVIAGDLSGLDESLDLMLGEDPLAARRSTVKNDYLGSFDPAEYGDAFVQAVARVASSEAVEAAAPDDVAEEEGEPQGSRASVRRRVSAMLRDVVISGLAFLAVLLALAGAPSVLVGASLVASLLAIVWSRRRVLRRPARWTQLVSSNVVVRLMLMITPLVVAARADVLSPILVVTVGILAVSVAAEGGVRSALARRGVEVRNLPGVRLVPPPLVPWGSVAVVSWVCILLVWASVTLGFSPLVPLVAVVGNAILGLLVYVRSLQRLRAGILSEADVRAALEARAPRFAVYFASTIGASYQVGMWLPYFDRLERSYVIVTRSMAMLRQLEAITQVPIIYRPTLRSLDEVGVDTLGTAFYVNNAVRNTHFVERRGLTHVWLNHGDSEKSACFNPVHAIYDLIFAAGQAGVDRYARNGVHIPLEKFEIVGRPQVEAISRVRPGADDSQPRTVLYAPTWRGPYADSRVYSLGLGVGIVTALLSRDVRVVFRVHPFNYLNREDTAAVERIGRLLAKDRARTGRQHVWGPAAEKDLSVEECFNLSDAMICDVSAVVSDYLQSDKPFSIVSVGRSPEQLETEAPAARASYVLREDLSNLDDVIDELLVTDSLAGTRAETRRYYLGDFPPDTYANGFIEAARRVIDAHPVTAVGAGDREGRPVTDGTL